MNLLKPWETPLPSLRGVICTGETGRHAEPLHPDWVRCLRDQCRESGVPFYFTGWGEWLPHGQSVVTTLDMPQELSSHHWHKWGDGNRAVRVGRLRAGRLLDDVLHDGFVASQEMALA